MIKIPPEDVMDPETLPDGWVERAIQLRNNTDMTWPDIRDKLVEEYGDDAPTSVEWIGTRTRRVMREMEETGEPKEEESEKAEEGGASEREEPRDEKVEVPETKEKGIEKIPKEEKEDEDEGDMEMDGKKISKIPQNKKLILLLILWTISIILLIASLGP